KVKTARHFGEEGKSERSIYRILARYEETKTANYKKIPGRDPKISSEQAKDDVQGLFERDPNTSVRNAATSLGMKKSTVSYIKVKKLGIKARTKKRVPKYTGNQEQRAKTGLRKIYEKCKHKVLVIDDETYVPVDPKDVPGRHFFHSSDPSQ